MKRSGIAAVNGKQIIGIRTIPTPVLSGSGIRVSFIGSQLEHPLVDQIGDNLMARMITAYCCKRD
jgi:hypothetical protein